MSDNDGGNRATVAGVSEKVDGLKALMGQGFEVIHRQLDSLAGLPERMGVLEERQSGLGSRVASLESAGERRDDADAEYRRVHRPTLIVASLALLVSLGALVAFIVVYT